MNAALTWALALWLAPPTASVPVEFVAQGRAPWCSAAAVAMAANARGASLRLLPLVRALPVAAEGIAWVDLREHLAPTVEVLPFQGSRADLMAAVAAGAPAVVSVRRGAGRHALVITGRDSTRAGPLLARLHSAGLATTCHCITGEPTVEAVVAGVAQAAAADCDLVIGFGGGSAIDAAKAIAILARNPGNVTDHLEVIGHGRPITQPGLPCLAIPTTAGTGAEVTRNSGLASPEHRVKVSLRSPLMLPTVALVDPELTLDLPPALTASTGMDALTQLIEPYTCGRTNPLVDGLCVEALPRVARSLQRAATDGRDASARSDMALASLSGGLALANAGLGAVHGFAGPIGGMFSAPHGAVCAALLPHVMAANLQALRERSPRSPTLARYEHIARLLTGNPQAIAADGVAWVTRLCRELAIPGLGRWDIGPADFPEIVEKAQ
ncbi:MAG: iron-containing alcohol dehydrogenase, partial [Myxococcales bacterium]|nr:iron-containing alcohol dehydrogenase [Myxococcales bacterium]